MAHLFGDDDPVRMYQGLMAQRAGASARRFDEYYRCYPVAMLPGPERTDANHGGKVFLPPSALEKLMRLHIAYPMLFELINGAQEKQTHAGVLEFVAEEGKIYLPFWLMQTLALEVGDLLRVRSTDLPPGSFIKLQPQSPDFLDITDPKAVLERAFANFSCLTVGDIFSFAYNDNVYEIAVLEVKPDRGTHAIATLETDLSVDFAEPLGYAELMKSQQAQAAEKAKAASGTVHTEGSMAKAINYAALAPKTAADGTPAASINFGGSGQRLGAKKAKSNTGASTPVDPPKVVPRAINGVQPLRLPHGKLFFGFPYVAPKKKDAQPGEDADKPHFQGMGQTLRGKKVEAKAPAAADEPPKDAPALGGQRLGKAPRGQD